MARSTTHVAGTALHDPHSLTGCMQPLAVRGSDGVLMPRCRPHARIDGWQSIHHQCCEVLLGKVHQHSAEAPAQGQHPVTGRSIDAVLVARSRARRVRLFYLHHSLPCRCTTACIMAGDCCVIVA